MYPYYWYETYQESGRKVAFVVVQPNINPFKEKFEGTENFIPFEQQLDRLIKLSESRITSHTSFVFWPETALDKAFLEPTIEQEPLVLRIKSFVHKHPSFLIR